MKSTRRGLHLELLEGRIVPAFSSIFNGTTLTLTQTAGDGDAMVTVTATTVVVADGSGTASLGVTPANLTVNMLSGSDSSLTVILNSPLSGNLTANLGGGNPSLNLDGTALTVNGNLRVTAGSGDQIVTSDTDLTVGGNVDLNLGTGSDAFSPFSGVVVGGNVSARGVNRFFDSFPGATVIGGNLSVITGENLPGLLSFTSFDADTIGGNLTYQGGSGEDDVLFDGGGTVGGFVNINLGNNIQVGTDQEVILTAVSIGGGLTVISGLNVIDTVDRVTVGVLSSVGGNVTLQLGEGLNQANLRGMLTGSSFYYSGGGGMDSVAYTPITGSARLRFTGYLGAGTDSVTFGIVGTNPSSAFIDFGAGTDSVTGTINFPFTFLNLP